MLDVIMISKTAKVGIGQIVETGETSTGKILEVDRDMNKNLKWWKFERTCKNISTFWKTE